VAYIYGRHFFSSHLTQYKDKFFFSTEVVILENNTQRVLGRLSFCTVTLILIYVLTPWCRVLLEKLTGLQLVKFPAFLWNPKIHYRIQKRPPPVPFLGQPNPVHISTSHLLEIHPNIIHPSTPRSPQLSLSLRFATKTLYA